MRAPVSQARVWVLTLAVGLVPLTADARFGKAASPSSGRSSGSSGSQSSSVHGSQPVGRPSYPGGGYGYSASPGYGPSDGPYSSYGYYAGYHALSYMPPYVHYGWGYGYYPVWGAFAGGVGYSDDRGVPQPESPSVVTTVGASVQGLTMGGAALALHAGIEGHRFGFNANLHSVAVPSDTSRYGTDAIHLFDAHLTYALLSGPNGRLRVEGGLDSAFTPDITMFGPGLAVSGALGLFGPVSMEARLGWTAYPFTQVDAMAGLTVALGPVGLRGGWRTTYLNDRGWVDGTPHEDVFSGPYIGLSLALGD